MKHPALVVGLLFGVSIIGCSEAPTSGWTTLIDGEKGLVNFDPVGDGNWRADGAAIVADEATDNSYLVTKKSYKEFQLRAEFWAERYTNSGILIRMQNRRRIRSENSYEVNIYDQRLG